MTRAALTRRVARLDRVERMRAIAHRQTLVAAAEAEATLAQLVALVARTKALAAGYADRTDATDGATLIEQGRFRAGLAAMAEATRGDQRRAQHLADHRAADVREADRRREAVRERKARTITTLTRLTAQAAVPLGGTRRAPDAPPGDGAAGDGSAPTTPAHPVANWHEN